MRCDASVLLSGMEEHAGWLLQQEVQWRAVFELVPVQPTEFSGVCRHELEPKAEALRVHVQRGRSCSIRFVKRAAWQHSRQSIVKSSCTYNSACTGLVFIAARSHSPSLARTGAHCA
jgi:hypothetical protein